MAKSLQACEGVKQQEICDGGFGSEGTLRVQVTRRRETWGESVPAEVGSGPPWPLEVKYFGKLAADYCPG